MGVSLKDAAQAAAVETPAPPASKPKAASKPQTATVPKAAPATVSDTLTLRATFDGYSKGNATRFAVAADGAKAFVYLTGADEADRLIQISRA